MSGSSCQRRQHLYNEEGRKASCVEGKVVISESYHLESVPWYTIPVLQSKTDKDVPLAIRSQLRLAIDTGDVSHRTIDSEGHDYTGAYIIPNFSFRIDVGETVVLYSMNNFQWPHGIMSHAGLVDALQILDDEGNVRHQSFHRRGLIFHTPRNLHDNKAG